MRRLILTTALLLAAVQTGQASLETDCYFSGGYFGSTYFGADYFDETVCGVAASGGYSLGEGQLRQDLRLKVE